MNIEQIKAKHIELWGMTNKLKVMKPHPDDVRNFMMQAPNMFKMIGELITIIDNLGVKND